MNIPTDLDKWENPRATAIAYLLTVAAIFATRYLPVIRTVFRLLYVCLGGRVACLPQRVVLGSCSPTVS